MSMKSSLRSLQESIELRKQKDKDKAKCYENQHIFDNIDYCDVVHDTLHEMINIVNHILQMIYRKCVIQIIVITQITFIWILI